LKLGSDETDLACKPTIKERRIRHPSTDRIVVPSRGILFIVAKKQTAIGRTGRIDVVVVVVSAASSERDVQEYDHAWFKLQSNYSPSVGQE
jgi:hypothetical protein